MVTTLEKRRPRPVDSLVPEPILTSTHAITVILLVRRRPTVTYAYSSNAQTRRWRCFRARCSSHSRRWGTASWKRGICEVFSAAARHRESNGAE